MTASPTPLAAELASLRAATRSRDARGLRALVLAILARLFARLEQVFLLWQSGQLPPFAPRDTVSPRATPSAQPRATPSAPPRPAAGAAARPRAARGPACGAPAAGAAAPIATACSPTRRRLACQSRLRPWRPPADLVPASRARAPPPATFRPPSGRTPRRIGHARP